MVWQLTYIIVILNDSEYTIFSIHTISDDWLNMVNTPGRGQPPDFVEAIFTCKGDFYDPNFPDELETINKRLLHLLNAGQ